MKLEEANINALTSENFHTTAFRVDNKMAQILFRDKLYTEEGKLRVIAQEYMANARDAHRAAGKSDTPIEVTLPSVLAPEFVVRDYGLGIPRQVVDDIFCVYGASTKKESNDYNGGYGIGAKCAFSYTKAFSVTTICGGIKYTYAGSINAEGTNDFILMDESPTDLPSGTEVRVPIAKNDIAKLRGWVLEVTHCWTPRPTLLNALDAIYHDVNPTEAGDRWQLYKNARPLAYTAASSNWWGLTVTVDDIPYVVTTDQARAINDDTAKMLELLRESEHLLVLNFKVGEVTIPPQRETIDLTQRTKDSVAQAVDRFIRHQVAVMEQRMSAATDAIGKLLLSLDTSLTSKISHAFGAKMLSVNLESISTESAGIRYLCFSASRRGGKQLLGDPREEEEFTLKDLLGGDKTSYTNAGKFIYVCSGRKPVLAEVKSAVRDHVCQGYGTVHVFVVNDPAKFQAVVGRAPSQLSDTGTKILVQAPREPRQRRSVPAYVLPMSLTGFLRYDGLWDVTMQPKRVELNANTPFRGCLFVRYDKKQDVCLVKGKKLSSTELCELLSARKVLMHKDVDGVNANVYCWDDRFSDIVDEKEVTFVDALIDSSVESLKSDADLLQRAACYLLQPYVKMPTWFSTSYAAETGQIYDALTALGFSSAFVQTVKSIAGFEYAREPNDSERLKAIRKACGGVFMSFADKGLKKALEGARKTVAKAQDELQRLMSHSPGSIVLLNLMAASHQYRVRLNGVDEFVDCSALVASTFATYKIKHKEHKA
jgi:hypothetical protein